MRPSCPYCAAKHISQAIILFSEAAQGYPLHWYLALGHLAEAGDELILDQYDLAVELRAVRKEIEGVSDRTHAEHKNLFAKVLSILKKVAELIETPVTKNQTERVELTAEIEQLMDYQSHDMTGHYPPTPVPTPEPSPTRFTKSDLLATPPFPDNNLITTPPPPACTPCEKRAREIREAEAALKASVDAADKLRQEEAHNLAVMQLQAPERVEAPKRESSDTTKRGFTVYILTTLADFDPSYSLATCIVDQANALAVAGHSVHLFVHTSCKAPANGFIAGVTLRPEVPVQPWEDDVVVEAVVNKWQGFLLDTFMPVEGVFVISHDLLFQSAYISAAKAIHLTSHALLEGEHVRHWFHVAHSSVGSRPQTALDDPLAWRCNLPEGGHSLVVLSDPDLAYFQGYYRKDYEVELEIGEDINVVRNIRDVRTFGHFSPALRDLATKHDLVRSTVIMYPFSGTRIQEKGVEKVIHLAALLRDSGTPCKVVLVAAHANNTPEMVQRVTRLKHVATHLGLAWGKDVIYTPEELPETAYKGLGVEDMKAMWSITDIFAFPSVSEAGSLVLLEALASRAVLVLNECLASSASYVGRKDAVWIPWGSSREAERAWDTEAVLGDIGTRLFNREHTPAGSWEQLGQVWSGLMKARLSGSAPELR